MRELLGEDANLELQAEVDGHLTHSVVRGIADEEPREIRQHGECLRCVELGRRRRTPYSREPGRAGAGGACERPNREDAHHAVLVRVRDKKPPSGSAATACGESNPTSGATVVIVPFGATRRMRLLPVSAIKNPPLASGETENGRFSCAASAGPPSPESPCVPLPATVVMTPAGEINRTRWLPVSGKRMLPSGSAAMPRGAAICANVAGPPSPEKPNVPVPAIVVMMPVALDTCLMRWLPVSAITKLPVGKKRDAVREVELGAAGEAPVAREPWHRRTHPGPDPSRDESRLPDRAHRRQERLGEHEALVGSDSDAPRVVDSGSSRRPDVSVGCPVGTVTGHRVDRCRGCLRRRGQAGDEPKRNDADCD